MIIGIVSGYFNPLHLGHIEYITAAKDCSDYLIVIINNDLQVKLKGSKPFMDQTHRCKIIQSLKPVDEVWISKDTDKTVCKTLELIKKEFPNHELCFFNSGDRIGNNKESAEFILCEKLKIKYIELLLPKKYSSSELLKSV